MPSSDQERFFVRLLSKRVYYGWVIVFCCFMGSLLTFGIIYSFSVFFGHISSTFNQSQANTSLVFSLQSIMTFGSAALLGLFIDRYGARSLLVLGALLVGIGLVGASQIPLFTAVLLSYGLVCATGLSLVYVISYATTPRWFDRRRGTATAIATSGGGVGILLGPPVASFLTSFSRWQDAYLIMTGATVAVLVLVALLIRDKPRDIGIDPNALSEFPDGLPDEDSASMSWGNQITNIIGIVRSGPFILVFIAYFCLGVPIFFTAAHIVEFTRSVGVGEGVGVLALSIVGGMNVIGKFIAGPISDRVGIPRTLAGCGVLLGVPLIVITSVYTSTAILGAILVFGLGYGGAIALLSPTVAELFGTDDLNALFGLTSVAFAVTGSIVPYLAGVGFDTFGTYAIPLLISGLMGVASVPAVGFARRRQAG